MGCYPGHFGGRPKDIVDSVRGLCQGERAMDLVYTVSSDSTPVAKVAEAVVRAAHTTGGIDIDEVIRHTNAVLKHAQLVLKDIRIVYETKNKAKDQDPTKIL
jgi:hypothetical protein